MKKIKKDLIILDLDGTLLYNPNENFTIDIDPESILEAGYFFGEFVKQIRSFDHRNVYFTLITGRDHSQREALLYHLRLKGYRIDNAIFINFYNELFPDSIQYYDDTSFMIHYWHWKVSIISELRESNKYKSITVIDNDQSICSMLRELNFNVVKVEIVPYGNSLIPIFTNFNPEKVVIYNNG